MSTYFEIIFIELYLFQPTEFDDIPLAVSFLNNGAFSEILISKLN